MSLGRPTAGVRFAVERVDDRASPDPRSSPSVDSNQGAFIYRGFVHLPEGDRALEVRVERPSGAARATVEGADAKLEAQAAALVRAATKSALAEGVAPPRKIVRWRGG